MGQVYANATLTIAATRSRDGNGGLFSKRSRSPCLAEDMLHHERFRSGTLSTATHPLSQTGVFVRHSLGGHGNDLPFAGSLIDRRGTENPLTLRAWAFQERLLSKRILHFGQQELVWECHAGVECECGHCGQTNGWLGLPPQPSVQKQFRDSVDLNEDRWTASLDPWARVVEKYSQLQLSYESDKLPALSGIAKEFMSHEDTGPYLAGLWKNQLPLKLAWTCSEPGKRPKSYRALTWSWASVDNATISTEIFQTLHNAAVLQDVSCTLASVDPTGQIKDAFLRLSAPVIYQHMQLVRLEAPKGAERFRYAIHPDHVYGVHMDISSDFLDCLPSALDENVICPIMSLLIGHDPSKIVSLILVPSRRVPNAYERIGCCIQYLKLSEEAEKSWADAKLMEVMIV